MALIHVARDGAKLGEFTIEQVRDGLGTGQFRNTDLGWQSGMAEWRPLSEFVAAPPPGAAPDQAVVVASAPTAAEGGGLPWERREQIGLFRAFFETVALLITRPTEAFAMMRLEGGLMDPLLFGLIGGCAATIISSFSQVVLDSIPGYPGGSNAIYGFGGGSWLPVIVFAVLSPLTVALGIFIWSGIVHLCLMLLGGATRSYEATLRVVCFTGGAANLFYIIPVCGSPIALVYTIVLDCIGLSRVHQITTGKALLAILLPLIVCCCGMALLVGAFFGSLGAFAEFLKQHH